MDTIHTAHILAFQNETVFLVRHGESAGHVTGTYGIPGGRLDGEESLEEAAVREFEEETGLVVHETDLETFPDNEYTADIQRKDGTTKRFTMHIFLAERFTGELKNTGETTPEWVSLDTSNLLPNVEVAIQAAQNFLKKKS